MDTADRFGGSTQRAAQGDVSHRRDIIIYLHIPGY